MLQKIALGTAQFGSAYGVINTQGQPSLDVVRNILEQASNLDIQTLDTAIAYGNSQSVLGSIGVADFQLISKIPSMDKLSTAYIVDFIEASISETLQELKLSSLYGLLLHNELDAFGRHAALIFDKLAELKQRGVVQKIGVSFYDFDLIPKVISNYELDLIQVPFNLFDQRLLNEAITKPIISQGIEVHCRSLFLQGALLSPKGEPPKSLIEHLPHFEKYYSFLKEYQLTQLQACILLAAQSKIVDKFVLGVDNLQQLEEIMEIVKSGYSECYDFSMLSASDNLLINPRMWRKN